MKNLTLAAVAALALSAAPAFAADMPVKAKPVAAPPAPTWDVAFGGVVMTDYNFRGISQSNKGPSAGAYFEGQYISPVGTFYAAVGGVAISWPSSPAFGFTDPSAEIDFWGGWRNTYGKFGIDLGFIYYHYPKEQFNGFTSDSDFWEVYAKFLYSITPDLSVGLNVSYTPDLLHYSTTFATLGISNSPDAVYLEGTFKWVLPWKAGDFGAFIAGQLGHWFIDDTGFIAAGYVNPSYTYWSLGLAFTYKALTLDLRYHDTDQNVADCTSFLLSAIGNPSNSWCGEAFIAALKVDTSINALK